VQQSAYVTVCLDTSLPAYSAASTQALTLVMLAKSEGSIREFLSIRSAASTDTSVLSNTVNSSSILTYSVKTQISQRAKTVKSSVVYNIPANSIGILYTSLF
jgi:hypothetical protein